MIPEWAPYVYTYNILKYSLQADTFLECFVK
jgi:hypothetical protein